MDASPSPLPEPQLSDAGAALICVGTAVALLVVGCATRPLYQRFMHEPLARGQFVVVQNPVLTGQPKALLPLAAGQWAILPASSGARGSGGGSDAVLPSAQQPDLATSGAGGAQQPTSSEHAGAGSAPPAPLLAPCWTRYEDADGDVWYGHADGRVQWEPPLLL